jgi:hypothetical protein
MIFSHHPDLSRSLAGERIATLLAEAEDQRRARRRIAQWRPARFRQPTADRQRVVIRSAADHAGRAA